MHPTILIAKSDNEFFVSIDKSLSPKSIRNAAKVRPHMYGEELLERLISCVFAGLLDIQREYALYYKYEYVDLEAFLSRKHGLTKTQIGALQKYGGPNRLLARGDLYCGGDAGIANWIAHAGGDRILDKLLRIERTEDED